MFPSSRDLASDLKKLNIGQEDLPLQHSHGIVWDLNSDSFVITRSPSLREEYCPLLTAYLAPLEISPVVLLSKILMRDLKHIVETTDWDLPIPEICEQDW